MQERVDHDARADVALEYSIKMIVSNQLHEHDFEDKHLIESDLEESELSEQSSSHRNHRRSSSAVVMSEKETMKAWYQ